MSYIRELFLKSNLYTKSINNKILLKNRSWLAVSNTFQFDKFIFREQNQLVIVLKSGIVKGSWE